MDALHFRMPVRRKAIEDGVKRTYFYNKEFALKTHIIQRERDYYIKNNIDFEKLKPGVTKGNEILIEIKFDIFTGFYTETWANKTKYLRAFKGHNYESK